MARLEASSENDVAATSWKLDAMEQQVVEQNVAGNWASGGWQLASDRESGDEGGRERERERQRERERERERERKETMDTKMSMHSLTPPTFHLLIFFNVIKKEVLRTTIGFKIKG